MPDNVRFGPDPICTRCLFPRSFHGEEMPYAHGECEGFSYMPTPPSVPTAEQQTVFARIKNFIEHPEMVDSVIENPNIDPLAKELAILVKQIWEAAHKVGKLAGLEEFSEELNLPPEPDVLFGGGMMHDRADVRSNFGEELLAKMIAEAKK